MMQLGASGRLWPPIAAVAFAALFTALGFWQVGRYEIKQALWNDFQKAGEQATLTVESLEHFDSLDRYTPVEVSGRYDLSRQILLDNRIRDGRPGVEVFTPLALEAGGVVLVNRGWLPMGRDRRRLPQAPGPAGPVTLRGLASPPPAMGIQLGELPDPESWPWLTPYLLPDRIQEALDSRLAENVVLLDSRAPGGFVRDWHPAMLSPERHLGYAVQWFALALAVAVVWVLLTVRQRRGVK